MNKATEYLRRQKVIRPDCTTMIINYDDGRELDLKELLEEFAAQSDWISVEDQEPEHEQVVIGVDSDGDVETGIWHKERKDIDYYDSYTIIPTHWQPLPKPPTT